MDIFMIAVMVWLGITFLLAIFAAGVAFGLSDYGSLREWLHAVWKYSDKRASGEENTSK